MAAAARTMPTTFDLVIVAPDETVYEGSVRRVITPGVTQELAILPDHTPLYAELKNGVIYITKPGGNEEKISIEGGIIRVRGNKVSVIVGF